MPTRIDDLSDLPAGLPTDLPDDVRRALTFATAAEAAAHEAYEWGHLVAKLMRMSSDPAKTTTLQVDSYPLVDRRVTPPGDVLQMLRKLDGVELLDEEQEPTGGVHDGLLVLSEAVEIPDQDTAVEVRRAHREQRLPHGVRSYRTVTGVLVTGWRFEVLRYRDDQPHAVLASPFERADFNLLIDELVRLNARLVLDLGLGRTPAG